MTVEKSVPEIRFKGFREEWEEKELGADVADIIGGGTPSTAISEFWDGDIDWYSPTEIGKCIYANGSQKKITAQGLEHSSAKILPAGNTVLFTSRAGIGDMAILTKSGATNQGFQSFVVKEGFSPYFLYSAGRQIKEFALKHASGSTFLEISGKQLGRMKIVMPSEEEQTAIGNYFQKLDSLINQHQQKHDKLSNIKKAMLEKMFPKEGKTVPEIRLKGFGGEWDEVKLGSIAKIKGRLGWKSLKQEEYLNYGPAMIAGKHIDKGIIKWKEVDHIPHWRYVESPEIMLRNGDVIFSKDGSLGNPAIVSNLQCEATINSTMMLVRPTSKLKPKFFYQVLQTKIFRDLI